MFVKGPEAFDSLELSKLAQSKLTEKLGGFLIFQDNFDFRCRSKRSWEKVLGRISPSLSKADQASFLAFFLTEERRFRRCLAPYWQDILDCENSGDWFALSRKELASNGPLSAAIPLSNAYFLGGQEYLEFGAELFAAVWQSVFERNIYSESTVKDFFAKDLADRHWSSWSMKGPRSHLYVPFLINDSCDENFAVRARIYRSLGQLGHPASMLCLREGARDPHPLARYEAVSALGAIADFGFVNELAAIAKEDLVERIRSAALRALHRIEGYWLFFGAWRPIYCSLEKQRTAVEQLLARGLLLLDRDLPFGDPNDPNDALYAAVTAKTKRFSTDFRRVKANNLESKSLESRIRTPAAFSTKSSENIQKARAELNSLSSEVVCLALCQASHHNFLELEQEIACLVSSEETEVEWHARRALRKLNWTRISQALFSRL